MYFERFKGDIITVGNHTNFKGMFNKERIENLEKRVKELERIEGISKLSEDVSKRLIHALIDSNNEVISKFELGVSFKKMYEEEARKRKELAIQRDRLESEMMCQIEHLKSVRDELLTATGCANFSDLKNKFLCKDIKRDELIEQINELERQRDLLDRDLRNQIAKLSDKNQSLMESEKALFANSQTRR